MRRLLVSLALLPLCLLLPPAARAEEQAPPARVTQVDASRYPEVTVYVRVADDAGQAVGGLDAADFRLTEGGVPVQLTGFVGSGASPVSAALVLDRSGSMAEAGKIGGARAAALAFVRQMRPGDRTALIPFSSRAEQGPGFDAGPRALEESLRRLEPDGGTALYDALVAGVDALRDVPGRRALLVLTDGQDCRDDPGCPDEHGSRRSLADALEYAADAGQPVFVVGLGERGDAGTAGIDEGVLRRIAADTGGEYFYAPDAALLADLYRRLSAGIQQEYALTYRSPRPFYDGTQRDIEVLVGGAPAAGGGYLQQHMLNVRSEPLVALALLLPIAAALALPGIVRGRRMGRGAATRGGALQTSDGPVAAGGVRALAEPHAPAALGATMVQPPEAAGRRTFCGECGLPLRDGARFCPTCGAPHRPATAAQR